jgi:hypothetical protein
VTVGTSPQALDTGDQKEGRSHLRGIERLAEPVFGSGLDRDRATARPDQRSFSADTEPGVTRLCGVGVVDDGSGNEQATGRLRGRAEKQRAGKHHDRRR